jgi:hypothetical protein
VQLDGAMTPERRQDLRGSGIEPGDYLPENAYVVRMDSGVGSRSGPPSFVRWLGRYRNEWKLAPEIGTVEFRTPYRQELSARGLQQLIVILFEGEDVDAAAEQASACGAQVLLAHVVGGRGILEVLMPAGLAADLAAIEAVQWIEEASEATFRNNTTRWIVQSNNAGQTPVWNHGIRGEGQIAGLLDGPFRLAHCDFVDPLVSAPGPTHRKVVAYRATSGNDAHGTHVAGILVGDQAPFGIADTYDGIAFAARVSFGDNDPVYYNPSTTYAAFAAAHADGARVHSNSWGDDGATDYILRCREIDRFMWENEDDLILFAVTNLSDLRAPENAKNLLAVGASRDAPYQGEHCTGGAGPTIDGRRRPEVFAPGCATLSANADISTCGVASMTGTSMACPVVAGAGLLVRQYFTEGFYPTGAAVPTNARTPSGALMKAILINGSVDMTGIAGYPSDQEGWGRLLLDNALYFPGDASTLYVEDVRNVGGLSTGQYRVFGFQVAGSSVPLRVTLVWTDYPATVGANPAAVNDLDLVVTGPGGVMYRGNVFSGGQSIPGGFPDPRNNTEQVHRLSPTPGNYTVAVRGTAVNQSTQGFALVVTGDIVGPMTWDCNGNAVSDVQDIVSGTSQDCQKNGVPDECEGVLDCNGNGALDVCEAYPDCNNNGLPDTCETFTPGDFNGDGTLDAVDFVALESCLGGPELPPSPGRSECQGTCNRVFDSDADSDVDLADFAVFAAKF